MMPGCEVCKASDTRDGLCLEGLRLITALGYARAVAKFSTAPAHARTHIHAAKAAYLEHKNGSWDDEPEPLSQGSDCGPNWPWTGPEWAGLLRTSQKHRAEIVARRAGMHQR